VKTKTLVACLFLLAVIGSVSYCYTIQECNLVVEFELQLIVNKESSTNLGTGWIVEQNSNFSIVKWPQMASEKIDLNMTYSHHEKRTTPIQFNITLQLNQTERTIITPKLTESGRYNGVVRSFFSGVKPGNYTVNINICILNRPETHHQLKEFITIP
jgi:hypothetical protein